MQTRLPSIANNASTGCSGLSGSRTAAPREAASAAKRLLPGITELGGLATSQNPQERFASVLRLSPYEYRAFWWLGHGLTLAEIANIPGEVKSPKTISTLIQRCRFKTRQKNLLRLAVFAAAWLESGLRREINEEATPYKFKEA